MSEGKHVKTRTRDLLRVAVALTVLEFKPDTDSIAAYILELERSSLALKKRKTPHGAENRNLTSTVSFEGPFAAQKEITASIQSRMRIGELEQEVKVLERKLLVAIKELTKRAKSAENVALPSTVHSPSHSSQKKQAASVPSPNTAIASTLLPLSVPSCTSMYFPSQILHPAAITPSSPQTKVKQPRVAGWSPSLRTTEMDTTTKAECGYKTTLMTRESGGSAVPQIAEKPDVGRVEDSCAILDCLPVPFADLPRSVKLLQASLFPSITPNASPPPSNLPTLTERSNNFISQLSQIVRLAYAASATSASRDTESASHGRTSVAPSSEQDQTLDTPIRIIGLAEALLSQLLPPILARVGDAESQEIVVAIAKGIIRPAFDFIIAKSTLPSGRTSENMKHATMVDSVTSLVGCLLQVRMPRNAVQSASVSGEPAGTLFTFAEVVALWSTELVCARVKHSIDDIGNVIIGGIASRQKSTKSAALNALITTFLGIIGRCIGNPFKSISSDNVAQDHDMERHQKPCIRLVNTRICDLLTKLIAELDPEVDTFSGCQSGTLFPEGASPPRIQDAEKSVPGDSQTSCALWEKVGLDRKPILAMCRVAEQMMVSEGAEDCEEPLDASACGWLKEICGEKQDWGISS